ncbi:serine/threonine protein kinase [Oleiphilus messinensis]|uniref:Serine/threonine protein kinase n=1 Tax=Oleiphilus messinensis TaxID=141451 RepID=A0A1Y0I845_9GAMM|nr:serine/threonine-protein kinase [Oleiphilus messinensis]ARU55614.1 serine/threonine protein kinase [Oleiphilus messinensis]
MMTPGMKIGRYEIVEKIGSGAMASVFRAFDRDINRTDAIKVLKEDMCIDQQFLTRFLSEAKAAGVLSHPNIVTIYDVGRAGNTPYIVMELVEGGTLADWMTQGEPMDIKRVLRIAIQVARALDYAHRHRIVHRDVKPGNIIFMPDGESVKLADFGIAHLEGSSQTQHGTVLGTPRYMSPEQAMGEALDGRSDLFSLGVILYELLTGRPAFDSRSMAQLMDDIRQKQPDLMSQLPKSIPKGLLHILQSLLEKKASKRPSTGHEVAVILQAELNAILDAEHRSEYLPFHYKWALIMGGIVTMILVVSVTAILRIQNQVLTDHAIDSGISLANFIAVESAIPVLGEDWITLESLVKEASERNTFQYLSITDHSGVVQVATDPDLVGHRIPEFTIVNRSDANSEQLFVAKETVVREIRRDEGQLIFEFQTPIAFNQVNIGQVRLGLSQDRLVVVKQVTTILMVILSIVTLLSVTLVLFIFGRLVGGGLTVLNHAMVEFSEGHFSRRISNQRNDEIGDLYNKFNLLADSVQQRLHREHEDTANAPQAEKKSGNKTVVELVKPKKR